MSQFAVNNFWTFCIFIWVVVVYSGYLFHIRGNIHKENPEMQDGFSVSASDIVLRHLYQLSATLNLNHGVMIHRTEKRFSLAWPNVYAESDSVNNSYQRKSPFNDLSLGQAAMSHRIRVAQWRVTADGCWAIHDVELVSRLPRINIVQVKSVRWKFPSMQS